jgi:peptide/nickel transport system substrate-binding protein
LVAVLVLSTFTVAFAEEEVITDIPRNETLYWNGVQWGTPNNWNLMALSNTAWPVGDADRMLVYEALYMYNMLTNENEPLLADGDITWEDDYNFTVKLKDNIHWNDGEPLTAEDVAYTYNIANTDADGYYTTWSNVWTYLDKCEVVDELTVRFTIKEEPYNLYVLPNNLANIRIIPKHFTEALFEECGGDIEKVREQFVEHPVGSGPYIPYFYDETRVVAIRDDNYWGQAENMFGKLAAPKYIAHGIYTDNAAGNMAFAQGEVDVAQQFMPDVWVLKEDMVDEEGNSLVSTWYDEAPYQLGAGSPSLLFNLQEEGLKDPVVHRAIAMCLDYEAIAQNAMSGYTEQLVPCFLNPTLFGDFIDWDDEELEELMWDTSDLDGNIEAANAMLEEAGYIDTDGDGFRELPDGTAFEWKAECPTGWSDWNASLEILCESAKKIGLNIVTYFPESSVYSVDQQTGNFEILMVSPYGNLSVAQPWQAFYSVLYSKDVPAIGTEATHNYNRYTNEEVDAMIDELAGTDDEDEFKELTTAIIKQWLRDMPTVQLMYRPEMFETLYEGVWTGFGKNGDTKGATPMICSDGVGIRNLYNITLREAE